MTWTPDWIEAYLTSTRQHDRNDPHVHPTKQVYESLLLALKDAQAEVERLKAATPVRLEYMGRGVPAPYEPDDDTASRDARMTARGNALCGPDCPGSLSSTTKTRATRCWSTVHVPDFSPHRAKSARRLSQPWRVNNA